MQREFEQSVSAGNRLLDGKFDAGRSGVADPYQRMDADDVWNVVVMKGTPCL